MAFAESGLSGKAIMIVEDEYLIALNLVTALGDADAGVMGPFSRVKDALSALDTERKPDAAVLDINVGGQLVFPVAERLLADGVPFIFATGYDDATVPPAFAHVERFEKPVDVTMLARALAAIMPRRAKRRGE